MPQDNASTPRVAISSYQPTQTPVPKQLPPNFFFLSGNGTGETGYGQRPAVQLTKQNISNHAGLVTVLENLSIRYFLPWAPKEQQELVIGRLELTGHTRTWPKQIMEQVDLLLQLELTRKAFLEAKRNLRVRDKIKRWVAGGAGRERALPPPTSN